MKVKLTKEKIEELLKKYNAKIIEKCPKCGKFGTLRYRRAGSHTDKYYFYVQHENTTCYFCRIEDIEEKLGSKTSQKKLGFERTLGSEEPH